MKTYLVFIERYCFKVELTEMEYNSLKRVDGVEVKPFTTTPNPIAGLDF